MADTEGVIVTFGTVREGMQAAFLADGWQALAAPGQDLMRVGLMADIPNQFLRRRVVDIVQGNGQLNDAQTGAKMAAGLTDAVKQKGTQLIGQER